MSDVICNLFFFLVDLVVAEGFHTSFISFIKYGFCFSLYLAYKRGFINKEQLLKLAEPLMKTDYGKYLVEVANGL